MNDLTKGGIEFAETLIGEDVGRTERCWKTTITLK
jgi:hypothetical protein